MEPLSIAFVQLLILFIKNYLYYCYCNYCQCDTACKQNPVKRPRPHFGRPDKPSPDVFTFDLIYLLCFRWYGQQLNTWGAESTGVKIFSPTATSDMEQWFLVTMTRKC